MVGEPEKTELNSTRIGVVGLGAALVLFTWANAQQNTSGARTTEAKLTAVIVELFTSEGCSSCPPADALLVRLDQGQPVPEAEVIPLGEHVDYWDHLGWRDRFSSAEFTARQNVYSRAFGLNTIYTPQMVVDGHTEFNGSDSAQARRAIARAARAPKAAVQVALAEKPAGDDSRAVPLVIRVDRLPDVPRGDSAEVLLAITEGQLSSDIRRGENAGRTMSHAAVVRRLSVLGRAAAGQDTAFFLRHVVQLDPGWNRKNLRAVVFVQERADRRILGASAVWLATE